MRRRRFELGYLLGLSGAALAAALSSRGRLVWGTVVLASPTGFLALPFASLTGLVAAGAVDMLGLGGLDDAVALTGWTAAWAAAAALNLLLLRLAAAGIRRHRARAVTATR